MTKWIDLASLFFWVSVINFGLAGWHIHPIIWALFCLSGGWNIGSIWLQKYPKPWSSN